MEENWEESKTRRGGGIRLICTDFLRVLGSVVRIEVAGTSEALWKERLKEVKVNTDTLEVVKADTDKIVKVNNSGNSEAINKVNSILKSKCRRHKSNLLFQP